MTDPAADIADSDDWRQFVDAALVACLTKPQYDCVQFGYSRNGRIFMGIQMGHGKSFAALVIMLIYLNEWPLLILSKAGAIVTWNGEIGKFLCFPQSDILMWNTPSPTGDESATPTSSARAQPSRYNARYQLMRSLREIEEGEFVDDRDDHEATNAIYNDDDNDGNDEEASAQPTFSLAHNRRRKEPPRRRIEIMSHEKARTPNILALLSTTRRFKCIIVDESECIQTWDSQTTVGLMPIFHACSRLLLLSGTGLNRPEHLFPQLHALRPDIFTNITLYRNRYCDPKREYIGRGQYRMRYSGSSNLDELHNMLDRTILFRYNPRQRDGERGFTRTVRWIDPKVDPVVSSQSQLRDTNIVARDLEAMSQRYKQRLAELRTRHARYAPTEFGGKAAPGEVHPDSREEGLMTERDAERMAADQQGKELHQSTLRHKILYLRHLILRLLRERIDPVAFKALVMSGLRVAGLGRDTDEIVFGYYWSPQRIILFAHHKFMMEAMQSLCTTFLREISERDRVVYTLVRMDGSNKQTRGMMCQHFNTVDTCLIGVLSTVAAGISINMTGASYVVKCELVPRASCEVQAEKRAHRMGQRNHVEILYPLLANSVEEHQFVMMQEQLKNASRVLDGCEPDFDYEEVCARDCPRRRMRK